MEGSRLQLHTFSDLWATDALHFWDKNWDLCSLDVSVWPSCNRKGRCFDLLIRPWGRQYSCKVRAFSCSTKLSTNIIWSFIYDCFRLCSCNTCCSREQRVSFVSIWLHPFSVLIMLEFRVRATVISLFWQQKITLLDMCNVQYAYLMCFCLGKSEWRIEDGLELFSICIDWFQRHCLGNMAVNRLLQLHKITSTGLR